MRSWMQPWFKDDDHSLDYESDKKIDMISGRYNVPKSRAPLSVLADALLEATQERTSLAFVSTKHGSAIRDEFCDALLQYTNSGLDEKFGNQVYTGVHLTTSGALAVEDAIKIAMQVKPGARNVIAFDKSYHGATFGAGSCTGEERRKYVEQNTVGFTHVKNPAEGSVEAIKDVESIIYQKGPETIACVVLEVVNTIHGLLHGNSNFFTNLQILCKANNIMLIVDEVLTGFGRTGKRFAFMNYPLQPDMICFSKAVTNGQVPLGGVILSHNVRKHFKDKVFGVGSTYAGYPLGCAVGLQALCWLIENEDRAHDLEQAVYDAWEQLISNGVKAKHFGLLLCINLPDADKARQMKQLLENEKIIVDQHDEHIIMAPPFDMKPALFHRVAQIAKNIYEKVLELV